MMFVWVNLNQFWLKHLLSFSNSSVNEGSGRIIDMLWGHNFENYQTKLSYSIYIDFLKGTFLLFNSYMRKIAIVLITVRQYLEKNLARISLKEFYITGDFHNKLLKCNAIYTLHCIRVHKTAVLRNATSCESKQDSLQYIWNICSAKNWPQDYFCCKKVHMLNREGNLRISGFRSNSLCRRKIANIFMSLAAHRFGYAEFWISNISCCFLQAGSGNHRSTQKASMHSSPRGGAREVFRKWVFWIYQLQFDLE